MGFIHACQKDLERLDGRSDWVSFIECCFSRRGFRVAVYYRLAGYLMVRGIRYLPSLIIARSISVTGADIPCEAEIGPGLLIAHPVGVVIGGRVRIGKNTRKRVETFFTWGRHIDVLLSIYEQVYEMSGSIKKCDE